MLKIIKSEANIENGKANDGLIVLPQKTDVNNIADEFFNYPNINGRTALTRVEAEYIEIIDTLQYFNFICREAMDLTQIKKEVNLSIDARGHESLKQSYGASKSQKGLGKKLKELFSKDGE